MGAAGTDGLYCLQYTGIGAQGLKQKIFRPLVQHPFRYLCIDLPGGPFFGIRHRPQVGKHIGFVLRSLDRQGIPCICQRLPPRLLPGCHCRQAKGVGLQRLCACLQIGPVDCQHTVRVGSICLLTGKPRGCFIIGAHTAIEHQRMMGQIGFQILHKNSFPFHSMDRFQFNKVCVFVKGKFSFSRWAKRSICPSAPLALCRNLCYPVYTFR